MRSMAKSMMVLAGLAMLAPPLVAQVPPPQERPAFERGIPSGGPGTLILENREALGLTDDQVQQIQAIRAAAIERYQAAREEMRPPFADRPAMGRDFRGLSAQERAELRQQMMERRQEFRTLMMDARDANREAGERIHGLLTEAQLERLEAIRAERWSEIRERRFERRGGAWQGRGGAWQGRGGAWSGRRGDGFRGPRGWNRY